MKQPIMAEERLRCCVFKDCFNVGDPVLVKCEDGKLIITPDTSRVELMEAEKAFMEEETKKLQERFLKEKKELHAKFVAERSAIYGM